MSELSRYFAMTLGLRDDESAAAWTALHQEVWPEVLTALRKVGVTEMKIFRLGHRLFMWVEGEDGFDPSRDFARLADEPRYEEWDELNRTYQERVPEAGEGEWWAAMDEVFDLSWPRYRQERV